MVDGQPFDRDDKEAGESRLRGVAPDGDEARTSPGIPKLPVVKLPPPEPDPSQQTTSIETEAFVAVKHINQRIAPFSVTQRLGSGAMAEVYLAQCSETNRVVAVKALRSEIRDPTVSARFRLEFDLLQRLNHPSIAKAFAFHTGDPSFFTMEYIQGQNLRQQFARFDKKPTTDAETLKKLIEVSYKLLEGLQYLHQNKIIHRDLKPENIMLVAEGGVKLLDFGVARTLEDHLELTCHNEAVGTLEYMAPEMLQNRVFDHRVDLYALGVILFQLLAGRRMFESFGLVEIYEAKVNRDTAQLESENWPECPWFIDVVNRLLQKRPEDRPRSTAEILRHFESHWRAPHREDQARPIELGASPLISIHNAPIYGRGDVLQEIEEWVDNPNPLPLLLHGASGTGKTRLLRATQSRLMEQGTPCLLIDSHEFDRSTTSFLQDVLFRLQDRFGRQPAADGTSLSGPEFDDTVTPAFFVKYVQEVLGRIPVILIDDIHLLPEPVFQQILHHFLMARAKSDGPNALWIFAYSDDVPEITEGGFLLPILDIMPCSQDIWLQPLDEMAVYHLAVHLMDGQRVDPSLVSDFYEYTGGLPYAVAHMLSLLVDDAHLIFREGQWQVDPSRTLEAPGELIEQFLHRKVSQLTPATQKVLELITVAGERVSLNFISEALSGAQDEDDRIVNELIIEQWVQISGSVLSFANPKIHRVLYQSIVDGRRQLIHHSVVRILERMTPGEPAAHLMQLLRHATQAEDEDRIFRYAMQVGVFFFKQNMFQEAQQYLADAIGHYRHDARTILLEAYLWNAECHLCLNQLDEARRNLELALDTLDKIPFDDAAEPEKHALMFRRVVLHQLMLVENRAGRFWEVEQTRRELHNIHEALIGTYITDPGVNLPVRVVHDRWPQRPFFLDAPDLETLQLFKAPFDTLLERERTGGYVGRLAKNWIWSAQSRELAFDLKKGLTFHNGALLHAKDVVFSFDLVRRGRTHQAVLSPHAARIQEVRADAKDRVVATYAPGPLPNLAFWANLPILPGYVYNHRVDTSPLTDDRGLIGSGPFEFDKLSDDAFCFHRAGVSPDRAGAIEISPKGWEGLPWLRKGKAHLVYLEPAQWHKLTPIEQFKIGVVRGIHVSNQVIRFCLKLDGERAVPLEIRRALYDCMLLKQWNESYLDRTCVVLRDGVLTSRLGELRRPVWQTRRERLTQAMEAAGYELSAKRIWEKDGQPFSLELVFPDWQHYRKMLQALAHFLGRRGIQVQPRFVDYSKLKEMTAEDGVDGWVDTIFPEPDYGGLGDLLHSGARNCGANATGYATHEMDTLIATLEQTPPGRRTAIQRRIDALFAKHLPWMPLYQVKVYYAFNARLEGLTPNPRGVVSSQTQILALRQA